MGTSDKDRRWAVDQEALQDLWMERRCEAGRVARSSSHDMLYLADV